MRGDKHANVVGSEGGSYIWIDKSGREDLCR